MGRFWDVLIQTRVVEALGQPKVATGWLLRRMTPEVLIYAKYFSGLAIISDDTPPKGVA